MATIFYGTPLEAFPVTSFDDIVRSPVNTLPVSPALTVKSIEAVAVADDDYEMTRAVTGYAKSIEKPSALNRFKSIFTGAKKATGAVGLGLNGVTVDGDVKVSKFYGSLKRGCKSSSSSFFARTSSLPIRLLLLASTSSKTSTDSDETYFVPVAPYIGSNSSTFESINDFALPPHKVGLLGYEDPAFEFYSASLGPRSRSGVKRVARPAALKSSGFPIGGIYQHPAGSVSDIPRFASVKGEGREMWW